MRVVIFGRKTFVVVRHPMIILKREQPNHGEGETLKREREREEKEREKIGGESTLSCLFFIMTLG